MAFYLQREAYTDILYEVDICQRNPLFIGNVHIRNNLIKGYTFEGELIIHIGIYT